MTLVLVGKIKSVLVLVSLFNAAGNACQVVCPFMEVSIIQIVLLLKYVLVYALELEKRQEWAKQLSHGWHSDGEIDRQSFPHSDSCPTRMATYHTYIRRLCISQCVLCVVCGTGLWKWNPNFMEFKLFTLRFEDLQGSQEFDVLMGEREKGIQALLGGQEFGRWYL